MLVRIHFTMMRIELDVGCSQRHNLAPHSWKGTASGFSEAETRLPTWKRRQGRSGKAVQAKPGLGDSLCEKKADELLIIDSRLSFLLL